eukprot:snap_masked-scaffold_12-processed-gene-12.23-mRNA-1 protein AED:1.00 eAED:1.00 QI:0/0/0/0/1/1/2/0/195
MTSTNKNEVICSICFMVFQRPFTFVECTHTFCEKCILPLLDPSTDFVKKKCPLCRVPVSSATYNYQIAKEHESSCEALKQEQERIRNENSREITQVNRSTFDCPFKATGCVAQNLDVYSLNAHLDQAHANDGQLSEVCPVCVSMPWGDPNYRSKNLKEHIKLRHKFEYGNFVQYDTADNEAAILQQVLARSVLER